MNTIHGKFTNVINEIFEKDILITKLNKGINATVIIQGPSSTTPAIGAVLHSFIQHNGTDISSDQIPGTSYFWQQVIENSEQVLTLSETTKSYLVLDLKSGLKPHQTYKMVSQKFAKISSEKPRSFHSRRVSYKK